MAPDVLASDLELGPDRATGTPVEVQRMRARATRTRMMMAACLGVRRRVETSIGLGRLYDCLTRLQPRSRRHPPTVVAERQQAVSDPNGEPTVYVQKRLDSAKNAVDVRGVEPLTGPKKMLLYLRKHSRADLS